jgi:hypothetical protein
MNDCDGVGDVNGFAIIHPQQTAEDSSKTAGKTVARQQERQ